MPISRVQLQLPSGLVEELRRLAIRAHSTFDQEVALRLQQSVQEPSDAADIAAVMAICQRLHARDPQRQCQFLISTMDQPTPQPMRQE